MWAVKQTRFNFNHHQMKLMHCYIQREDLFEKKKHNTM